MASYPEVQKRAQVELEAVIGPHRLPEFSDRKSLPYLNALMKELLRWRSVVPVGVPHCSLQDDEYRGYFIPKGSVVIANIWYVFPRSGVCGPHTRLRLSQGHLQRPEDLRRPGDVSAGTLPH